MKDTELQANYDNFSSGKVTVRGRERMLNAEEMCKGKGQIL